MCLTFQLILSLVYLSGFSTASQIELNSTHLNYPKIFRNESSVDDYFGTKVVDPYRWLENSKSDETNNFISEQNAFTTNYLEGSPDKKDIAAKLSDIYNYQKSYSPFKFGSKYFTYENSGLQNQKVLYVQEVINGPKRVLIDPNELDSNGTITIELISASQDGELLAYGLSKSGSSWMEIQIKNVSTGIDYNEVIRHVKYTEVVWTHDNLGFFYARYPEKLEVDGSVTENQKIYYHKLNTKQSEDALVVEFPDQPKLLLGFGIKITDDGEYFIITPSKGFTKTLVYYANLKEPLAMGFNTRLEPATIVASADIDASYEYVTSEGSTIYFRTNKNAPNYKVVGIDLSNPEEKYWSILIPERENAVLEMAKPVDSNKLFLKYLKDVQNFVELRNIGNGTLLKTLSFGVGSVQSFTGSRSDTECFFDFASYVIPSRIYRLNFNLSDKSYEPTIYSEVSVKAFDASKYAVTQVFYLSKDGTKVPMSIVHKKDIELSGENPVFLYGYGGFGFSIKPHFSPSAAFFLKHMDGIYAVPSIRGGGEYGEKWHTGGQLFNKQNSFDDFAAAAEYLIEQNYTNPSKLTIEGLSNGGLLIGASINQRPELFGAAIGQIGLYDMLRYKNLTTVHIGCSEYGCSDDKKQFENLIKYSPLHNVRVPKNDTVQYPAVLLITGAYDDRVGPANSYKFVSELQYEIGLNSRQTNPLLLRIQEHTGHGRGSTFTDLEKLTDIFTFLVQSLGLKFKKY